MKNTEIIAHHKLRICGKVMIAVSFGVLVAGCGPSAQEKVAQEQLKAIEQQKEMIKGFEESAKKAQAEADAALAKDKEQPKTYQKWNLYPAKK